MASPKKFQKDKFAPVRLTKNVSGRKKADRAVLVSLNTWLWNVCRQAAHPQTRGMDENMGARHPFIALVNKEADRLVKAFRAVAREQVRELPGRAQAGEVDRAMRDSASKIGKVLK